MGRSDQAVAVSDDVVDRFGDTDEPAAHELVAQALLKESDTFWGRLRPIGAVLVARCAVDPEARPSWGAPRTRTGWRERGRSSTTWTRGLRAGLDRAEATDLCWLAMGNEPYQQLVIQRGWAPGYWQWLTAAVSRELLERD